MARQRKLSPERKAFINSLLEHYQPTDANDVQEMLKDLLGILITHPPSKFEFTPSYTRTNFVSSVSVIFCTTVFSL